MSRASQSHQAAARDEVAEWINRRQAVVSGEPDDRLTVRRGEQVRQHDERATGFARNLLDYGFRLGRVVNLCSKRI
jgi:hypothetical protein